LGPRRKLSAPAPVQKGSLVAGGRLSGRRILITGGGSGVGAATCRLFAAQGARIAVLDRDEEALQAVIEETGGISLVANLLDHDATRDAVEDAARELGGLDGVVNCAGISVSLPFAETDMAAWDLAIGGNLTSIYLVCRAALPYLRNSGAATIVNISSAVAMQPLAGRAAYAASKSGVIAFSKVLAMELAPSIRCNVICPGAIDTPMVRNTFTDPAQITRIESLYGLKRMGEPQEVADAILFLTSGESSFVTGSTLVVDGGRIYY
jgi:NAD(P)-dependent dehydrogenase (short-subunit alcohol dehydrogenase family)